MLDAFLATAPPPRNTVGDGPVDAPSEPVDLGEAAAHQMGLARQVPIGAGRPRRLASSSLLHAKASTPDDRRRARTTTRPAHPWIHNVNFTPKGDSNKCDYPTIELELFVVASQSSDGSVASARGRNDALPHLGELVSQFPSLTKTYFERLSHEIAAYGAVPASVLKTELAPETRRIFDAVMRAIAEGRGLRAEELTTVGDLAAEWADDGLELVDQLEAYSIATEVLCNAYAAIAPERHHAPFMRALWHQYRLVQKAATVGYSEGLRSEPGMQDLERRRLLDQILTPDLRPHKRLMLVNRFADTVDVLQIRFDRSAAENEPGRVGRLAGRRKVRRANGVARAQSLLALTNLRPRGGLILLPAREGFDLSALVEELTAATGVGVITAHERCDIAETFAAAERLRDVLFLGAELHPGRSIYRMEDVVMEYQITRPGLALDLLLETARPLEGHPELSATLLRYLIKGRNRRRTALDLNIHPNTVDYRVAKAVKLTGLDPAIPADACRLHAALVALHITRERSAARGSGVAPTDARVE